MTKLVGLAVALISHAAVLDSANSDQLKALLFEDQWERQFFIDEWILSDEPSHSMPGEPEEQQPQLGAILVRLDEEEEGAFVFAIPRIVAEFAFIDADVLEAKKDPAYTWVKDVSRRDIFARVFSYRLTDDRRDFETLELLALPWLPSQTSLG